MKISIPTPSKIDYLVHVKPENFKRSGDFVKSPFRYPGGKYYALQHILPYINCVEHDEFREPFVGGGSIFFAKPKVQFNWLNDLETDLVTTYRVMADAEQYKVLADQIANELADSERHAQVKRILPKSALEVAFKTFYLNRTSYSGIINKPAWGYVTGKSAPPSSWVKFVQEAHSKLMGVRITSLDFSVVVRTPSTGKRVLIYLDPPYFHADQKRAYTKPFQLQDHIRLAALLRQTEFLFCLSYDDCTEIRKLYEWAEIHPLTWLYNTANLKGETRKRGNELIITNYRILKARQTNLL